MHCQNSDRKGHSNNNISAEPLSLEMRENNYCSLGGRDKALAIGNDTIRINILCVTRLIVMQCQVPVTLHVPASPHLTPNDEPFLANSLIRRIINRDRRGNGGLINPNDVLQSRDDGG